MDKKLIYSSVLWLVYGSAAVLTSGLSSKLLTFVLIHRRDAFIQSNLHRGRVESKHGAEQAMAELLTLQSTSGSPMQGFFLFLMEVEKLSVSLFPI